MRRLEIEHQYGKQVHILDDLYLTSVLTELSQPQTTQPLLNEFMEFLYSALVKTIVNNEFPTRRVRVPTRMTEKHPSQLLEAEVLDVEQRAISVNLARAGTFPSHICYRALNYILAPSRVRQDHITASRQADTKTHQIVGTSLVGSKIGGDIKDAILIFPDPMGATGSTIVSTLDYYKKHIEGKPKKIIALHLIVTPEYLARVTKAHPDIVIYAVRVDRGLSKSDVLSEIPGKRWSEEHGLDDTDYIVPGAGGLGELLNNSNV